MEKYQFSKDQLLIMERSAIPFAVYQFIDNRVVTLALSKGAFDLLGFETREEAYDLLDNDMYRDVHPDDVARISDEAHRFATLGGSYNEVYRIKVGKSDDYSVLHAMGEHYTTSTGIRIAIVWYTMEGPFIPSDSPGDCSLFQYYHKELHTDSFYRRNSYDYLTGLPNMTRFFELADSARTRMKEEGKVPAIVYLDLNGIKHFNRKYGFEEGDKLLRALARALTLQFSSDSCGRFADDHFAVITDSTDLEEQLEHLFHEYAGMNDGLTIPVRAGIYLDQMGEIEISTACDRAKYACDAIQRIEVSTIQYFDEQMLEESSNRQYIIDNFDRALNEGWIQVYYQPIIRTANGRVSDEEALARWIDPVRGFLSPAQFIPFLEDTRLITKLDLYVIDRVLEKMKRQAKAGLYVVPVSVNLSRVDFDTCDIVEEVRTRIDKSGIERDKLTIEITESVIGSDFEFMKSQIERFQSLGFKVWMDDFGNGYSSLDVLQSVRFDLIKLDMRFMQEFSHSESTRIILTELIKMAIGMGIDTVSEGVEEKEQADFLREVGCTKQQGFYYCKPLPQEAVMDRYRRGTQIGFENPAESDYYSSLGRINFYDVSNVASEMDDPLHPYFDTLPTAVLEVDHEHFRVIRANQSYRTFMEKSFGLEADKTENFFSSLKDQAGDSFARGLRRCARDGNRSVVSEQLPNGTVVHSLIRRVAINPVTGVAACAVVVLGISDDVTRGITYTNIAQALSADYINLYYVNLDTDSFVEYSSASGKENIDLERHGENFFESSHRDAMIYIHEADRERFIETFQKETIIRALNNHGSFTLTYRLLIDGVPTYVNLKAVRMHTGVNHIIIGVNNVDAQMRHQEAFERLEEERNAYQRINALSEDFLVVYTIDPVTEDYYQYSAVKTYEGLGLAKAGKNFFEDSRLLSMESVYEEDRAIWRNFTKERVMKEINDHRLFAMNFRLLFDGRPNYVTLKIAMVKEADGDKLIAGIIDIDEQVRRDREYAYNLAQAQYQANIDELTGVKNKHAYVDAEARLNRRIEENEPVSFAIAIFDVNDLKLINDQYGHHAGDAFLRKGCTIICDLFKRSPVYRIGGDEFAVIAQGEDYQNLEERCAKLDRLNHEHLASGDIVIACGTAVFDHDRSVASVFERADAAMYANKRSLKQ